MLRLRIHLLPLLRAASPLPSPLQRGLLLLSTSASTSPAPFSLEDYLVAACGLAPAQARKVSKKAFDELSKLSGKPFEETRSRLLSASNPDSVLALLSSIGLSRADVAAVVSADPLLLRSSVEKIGPRLLALRDRVGLSDQQIARFLLVGSRPFRACRDVGTNLEFFISQYCSFEEFLFVIKRSHGILFANLERVIKPNIAQLRQCGLSVREIVQVCSRNPRVLTYDPERVKKILLRVEELGVPSTSRMFGLAVAVFACCGEEAVAAKIEFLERTLGCSKAMVSIAVSKKPTILGLSEGSLLRKIKFLMNQVGMKPECIVKRPEILTLSLEKRLVPRHCVMKVLEAKGWLNGNISFYTFANTGEKAFKLKFIEYYKDSVPGLEDVYAAACAGDVNPEVQI
ncbi:hypothetical protein ACP70R_041571 [Stipagrostis hirtigluma subsp. patula]